MTQWGPDPVLCPRQVPEYAQAAEAEVLPRVPTRPPTRLPGPTAHRVMMEGLAKAGVAFAVTIVSVLQIPKLGLPELVEPLIMVPLGLVPFVILLTRILPPVGDRSLQELARGYTTRPVLMGDFWPCRLRGRRTRPRRTPWDYRGLWVYDGRGERVISAPDFTADPPGFYPSPDGSGSLELWTGAVWSGHLRQS